MTLAVVQYQAPSANHVSVMPEHHMHRRAEVAPDLETLQSMVYAELDALKGAVQKLDTDFQDVLTIKTGPQGPRGFDGIDGERGPRGYRGPQGEIGKTGRTGDPGPRGADGSNGYCALWDEDTGDVHVPCPQLRDAANAEEVAKQKRVLESLARQVVISEIGKEQRIRYEGGSGLTQTRGYRGGDKSYHEASYTNVGFANFHNHANYKHLIGMGEVAVVLNGVEFWTRHNDYTLATPDPVDTTTYHKTKYVQQPDVPPEVLAYTSVEDQSEEMRRWFHAWQDEDPKCPSCKKLDEARVAKGLDPWDDEDTERYYPDYFRPVLCVMEGAWIKQELDFEESFFSDRHFVDAKDWRELYDKNRFLYQSGRKSTQENLPFLPLSVRGLEGTGANETTPAFANWEYRIICTRLKNYLPLYNFKVASDLAVQMGVSSSIQTQQELANSRRARFDLNLVNSSTWKEGQYGHSMIDELMYEMPGKDGYNANLTDDAFGAVATHLVTGEPLNTARYTRYYGIGANDAMGRSEHRRGFNDPTLWAAMTTQDKIQGVTACTAELINGQGGDCTEETIKSQKWTWAVPLEIIYTTPLASWNPYDLEYCSNVMTSAECAHVQTGPNGNRNGGLTQDTAFKGTSRDAWYVTPEEFYSGGAEETDAADTSGGVTGVLDKNGVIRKTRAAGHWVVFPDIKGFNHTVRQRYPIMPIHEHGKTAWKEVKALQDIVLGNGGSAAFQSGLEELKEERVGVTLKLGYASGHDHTLTISPEQLNEMDEVGSVKVTSSTDNGHAHEVTVSREIVRLLADFRQVRYIISQCDSGRTCEDGSLGDYDAGRANLDDTIMGLNPWAYYTRADTTYSSNGTWAEWKDSSGNDRHTTRPTTRLSNGKPLWFADSYGCYKHDVAPDPAGVICNRYQGLEFPEGSIPSKFTILMRAKYMTDNYVDTRESWTLRGANRTSPRWALGHAPWGRTGVSWYDDRQVFSASDSSESMKFRYHTFTARSTELKSLWVDGVAKPQRDWSSETHKPLTSVQLALNAIEQDYGSDMAITDLIIFDYELTDEQTESVSKLVQDQPKRPVQCCSDLHASVYLL